MSTPVKVVIAVLVAVVVLYVVAVGVGAGADVGDVSAEDQPGIVGVLLDRFGDQADAERSELISACLQPDGTLLVPGSCELRVAAGDKDIRMVRLVARGEVRVTAPAPRADAGVGEVTKRLKSGDEVGVAVGSDEATVTLSCVGFGQCVVELVGER